MAKPDLLHAKYRGMVQDVPRNQLPAGAMWSIKDAFPNMATDTAQSGMSTLAPLRKRGGWIIAATDDGTNSAWKALAAGVLSTGTGSVIAVSAADTAWINTGAGFAAQTSTANAASQIVLFDDLFIMPVAASGGAAVVRKVSGAGGGACANLGGTPPVAHFACVHKSRLVLGNATSAVTTVYFSAVQDPETWDVDAFVETTYRINGLASLGNSIFVFSQNKVEVIRGSTPPNSAGTTGDLTLDGLFDEGLLDARSIATHEGRLIWAGPNGIFQTDGSAIENITELGGMLAHWKANVADLGTNPVVSAGIYNGWYIVSVKDRSIAYAVRLEDRTFVLLTNVIAWDMVELGKGVLSSFPQFWFSPTVVGSNFAAVFDLGTIFTPNHSYVAAVDGNSTTVVLDVEFPFFEGNPGSRRWKDIYLGVEALSVEGSSSYLKASYVTTSDAPASAYADVANDSGTVLKIKNDAAGGSISRTRFKLPIRRAASGIGLRVQQSGKIGDVALYELAATVSEREGSRGATLLTT